jgi:hypothetical protein
MSKADHNSMSQYNEYHNTSDDRSTPDAMERTNTNNLEVIRTISRVPGNPNYYEKNGLRTEGDGADHNHENKVRYRMSRMLVR